VKKTLAFPLLAASALACTGAFAVAQDPPAVVPSWYIGLGGGGTRMNDRDLQLGISSAGFTGIGQTTVGGDDLVWTGRVGFRFHRYLAMEANYWDLGKYNFTQAVPGNLPTDPASSIGGTTKAKAYGVSLVGILPATSSLDFYARAGYARTELDSHASGNGFTASSNQRDNGFTGGVGARWNLPADAYHPAMSVFLEYQNHQQIDVSSAIAGVELRF
jgi:OOP family OmpA-OmpF porin